MKTNTSLSGSTVNAASRVPRPARPIPEATAVSRKRPGKAKRRQEQLPDRPPPHNPRLRVPPILLQGDNPAPSPVSGPIHRYALGPAGPVAPSRPATTPARSTIVQTGDAPSQSADVLVRSSVRSGMAADKDVNAPAKVGTEPPELPEAYGTGKLLLVARDPHWLYAHWDLTEPQQRHYNAVSADHHLILRVFHRQESGQVMRELHLRPDSRHWFIRVECAGTEYRTELGCYRRGGQWMSAAISGPATTPTETISQDKAVRWAAIVARDLPPHSAGPSSAPRGVSLIPSHPPETWTPERARALAEVLRRNLQRPRQIGSAEIAEFVREEHEQEFPTGAPMGISSLGAAIPPSAAFWLNLNAELIIYGATARDAKVTLGGQPVQLRPDGTFSCRFALPDGQYRLAVAAISAQNESRQAELTVSRRTEHDGAVGEHPQDPTIASPEAQNAF
jgi:uncharacterized protein